MIVVASFLLFFGLNQSLAAGAIKRLTIAFVNFNFSLNNNFYSKVMCMIKSLKLYIGSDRKIEAKTKQDLRDFEGPLLLIPTQNIIEQVLKTIKVTLLFFFLFFVLNGSIKAQDIRVVKFADLQKWKNDKSDTVYVINFWATWCKPCLVEMPAFESLGERFAGAKVKVLMVSLDAPTDLENKVKPYVRKYYLRNPVYLYHDPKVKKWQQKLHPNFSGSLPATLIHQGSHRYTKMITGPMSYMELYGMVNELLQ